MRIPCGITWTDSWRPERSAALPARVSCDTSRTREHSAQFEHTVFHYLWTDTPRGIIWLLYQHPGLTRQHIADALAISGPSVTRQMDNLIEDGIVENRFPGRSNHYYLTAEAALTIDKLMIHAPVMIHKEAGIMPISATAG